MGDENYRKCVEERIDLMWKTIEDLKQKVAEERQLLEKERCENERLRAEQMMKKKKKSMYHLPSCPALSVPCPVHDHRTLPEPDTDDRATDFAVMLSNSCDWDNTGMTLTEGQGYRGLRTLEPF